MMLVLACGPLSHLYLLPATTNVTRNRCRVCNRFTFLPARCQRSLLAIHWHTFLFEHCFSPVPALFALYL